MDTNLLLIALAPAVIVILLELLVIQRALRHVLTELTVLRGLIAKPPETDRFTGRRTGQDPRN